MLLKAVESVAAAMVAEKSAVNRQRTEHFDIFDDFEELNIGTFRSTQRWQ